MRNAIKTAALAVLMSCYGNPHIYAQTSDNKVVDAINGYIQKKETIKKNNQLFH